MEGRKLKWYLKKKGNELGVTPDEYYKIYYKKNVVKIDDIKAYRKNYYINNKDKWKIKKGCYIYAILDADSQEYLYIGSTCNIKGRISYHKCCKAIRQCIEERINYEIFYIELDKDEVLKSRYDFEMFLITKLKPKWNDRGETYDEVAVRNLLIKYNEPEFKSFNN